MSPDNKKNIIFGYLTCLRLLPNYTHFFENYHFGNPKILRDFLNEIRLVLINEGHEINYGNYARVLLEIAPEPHNFDTILASSALDTCSASFELLSYIKDGNKSHIDSISMSATDSVHMYIQDSEEMYMENYSEEKIATHPLMIRERKIQEEIWNYLNKVSSIDEEDLTTLEKLQFNEGRGNLDLK